ncbi:DUF2163 domain-containing protein [Cognatishimia sp. F0-27]|uniref:DUF2163 domain-containing protein n=1 Tax=Cognatishimia sp. F0-27 TaxID=2816855 RepID=UPI001D0C0F70|nr:DUF2163 domain-containing protein [Cognatishimia sp. F0-27]MCC1493414.1 DUF2163 domain-containing protein [Cognatishimia sp. F0-27]
MVGAEALHAHLESGTGTVARCWSVTRRDGVRFGFTDHDCDLAFDGIVFRAETGMTAKALQQATGLSVDNSEAMGALSDAAIREDDIAAGRFDGADVVAWLVNWQNVGARKILFRGTIGEIRRGAGAFNAELRGLTEKLNRPVGRVFQKPCSAVLGDRNCGFDLETSGFRHEAELVSQVDGRVFDPGPLEGFGAGWFERGRIEVMSGNAAGLSAAIKHDRAGPTGARVIEVWEPLRLVPLPGDIVRLTAGCDKRFTTCREKFDNVLQFQGFPDIPEEDWLATHPTEAKRKDGGSRR